MSSPPFRCEICRKDFAFATNCARHTKTVHQRIVRKQHCPVCNKLFRADNLARHVVQIHTNPTEPCQCSSCFECFSSSGALVKHCDRVHGGKMMERKLQTGGSAPNPPRKVIAHDDTAAGWRTTSDPIEAPFDIRTSDTPMGELFRNNWARIRTFTRHRKLQKVYNVRLGSQFNMIELVNSIHHDQQHAYKLNLSPGFVLRNRLTDELRYYYGSENNNRVFPKPFLVKGKQSLEKAKEALTDFVERAYDYAYNQKPNSSWVVEAITNLTVTVHPIPAYPIGFPGVVLPEYVINNRGLYGLTNTSNGVITDHICVFRCIALHNGASDARNLETQASALFSAFCPNASKATFRGILLSELSKVEETFKIGIAVYELVPDADGTSVSAKITRSPLLEYNTTMKVCQVNDSDAADNGMSHFCYIHDFGKFAHIFSCSRCDKLWPTEKRCRRHEKTCTGAQKLKLKGGVYHPTATIFEDLADEGVFVPDSERIFPYRCTYDIECYLEKADQTSSSGDLIFTRRHIPMSVSICSNVPGFETAKNFVIGLSDNDSGESIITSMIQYMEEISKESSTLLRDKFKSILDLRNEPTATTTIVDTDDTHGHAKPSRLEKILGRLDAYIDELPCIGFNSARYDVNVVKSILVPYLFRHSKIKFVVKKQSAFFAISTPTLKFLDINNFLAPGYSYDKFLKAFKCSGSKGHFPFDHVDSPAKLFEAGLPPRSAFYDSLRQRHLEETDYQHVKEEWERHNMVTLKDLLVHYNNNDVEPFIEALAKYCNSYAEQGVDPFKEAISVPGLAFRELFRDIDDYFFLFDDKNYDLFRKVKDNLVGGLSIILHRYHEAGVTKIRQTDNIVQKIVGFDANSLYMGCTCLHEMPCGMFGRRSPEKGYKITYPRKYGRMMKQWLDYVSATEKTRIRHQFNSTEKVLTKMRDPVRADGWCAETNTVYQFMGCFWHGHKDCATNSASLATKNAGDKATYAALLTSRRLATDETNRRIRDAGYNLVIMRECEWLQRQYDEPTVRVHCEAYESPVNRKYGAGRLTTKQMIKAIKDGTLFGMVECNIEVPLKWPSKRFQKRLKTSLNPREYFSEFPPIMKHALVTTNDIGDTMKAFVENNNLSDKPRRMLIASYFGESVLLATPMIQWLLKHGLCITRIHTVIEYERATPFVAKADNICNARRAGDADPSLAILADMKKTTGNSFYSKSITAQENQLDVKYMSTQKASSAINSPFFQSLETLEDCDDPVHEVTAFKKFIKFNLPVQIGFFTYQLAKLRMLQFLYDCIDRYIDRSNYQLLESDTDSFYMAISADTIFDVLKPDMADEFYRNYGRWFPAMACDAHHEDWSRSMLSNCQWIAPVCCLARQAFEKRTPELFKVEWEGLGFIGLCSKTYYCWGATKDDDKYAAKGVNKNRNAINKDTFLDVLRSQQSHRVENSGFRMCNGRMMTYTQAKDGMTYNYWKRIVRPDGVSTDPLMI